MKTMYRAVANSPDTTLSTAITAGATTIQVADASKLGDAPCTAVIYHGETIEKILYTGKTGNTLTGVQRGYKSTAISWASGTTLARLLTDDDWDTVIDNILELQPIVITGTISASQWVASGDNYMVTITDTRLKSNMNMTLGLADLDSIQAYSNMSVYRGQTNNGSFTLLAINPPETGTSITFFAEARVVQ